MKRTLLLLLSMLSVFVFTACMSAVNIYKPDGTKAKGIPFYVKKAAFKQTTAIARYKYEVKLTHVMEKNGEKPEKLSGKPSEKSAEKAAAKPAEKEYVIIVGKPKVTKSGEAMPGEPRPEDVLAQLGKLNRLVVSANTGSICIDAVITAVNELPGGDEDFEKILSNTFEEIAVVDYSQQFYLNARASIFGSSTLSGELNADGSLSKASTTVTPGATEAISTLLPLKEVLSSTLGVAAAAKGEAAAKKACKEKGQLKLSMDEVGTIYEFTEIYAKDPRITEGCVNAVKCKLNPIAYDINKPFTTKTLGGAAKEENSKNKIKLSGEVSLPDTSTK